jgi:hypothetical protein
MSPKISLQTGLMLLAAAICGVLFTTTPALRAQEMQVLAASPPAQDVPPEIATSRRLVLHDVNVSGPLHTIDPASRPVLDYAVRLLRKYPGTAVYVSGEGDRATVQQQARAVEQYLKRRGIAADRVALENAVPARTGLAEGASGNAVVVLNLSAPACRSCS